MLVIYDISEYLVVEKGCIEDLIVFGRLIISEQIA